MRFLAGSGPGRSRIEDHQSAYFQSDRAATRQPACAAAMLSSWECIFQSHRLSARRLAETRERPQAARCGPFNMPSEQTLLWGQARSLAISASSIPVAITLSTSPDTTPFSAAAFWSRRIAFASRMSAISVLLAGSLRSTAISATVFPAYSGFGA